ncbi:hypothetical protein [Paenibacillus sp. YYML68]|nr:hypothetical protein [Paenibacillus sp. YYML68]
MDEQKETITSYDPKSGQSKQVKLVLDHDGPGDMKLSVEPIDESESEK